jgi:hypothetical protein
MACRTAASLVSGSIQATSRLEPAGAEPAMASAASASPSRPRHFGAPLRHARHARPPRGCRSFDLSVAFERLEEDD